MQLDNTCASAGTPWFFPLPQSNLFTASCTTLTVGPGLSSEDLKIISGFTRLVSLLLTFDDTAHSQQHSDAQLPDSLTQLTRLQRLSLECICAIPTSFSSITSLQDLHIAPSSNSVQDLSNYTHLTALAVTPTGLANSYPVLLPFGDTASLQLLTAQTVCKLSNLSCTTQLTRLELCPDSMSTVTWPEALPHLQCLTVDYVDIDHAPPDTAAVMDSFPTAWQAYQSVEEVSLPAVVFHAASMPSMVSMFPVLRRLIIGCLFLQDFPKFLLDLVHLEVLYISKLGLPSMPSEVLLFAKMPHLQCFHVRLSNKTGFNCAAGGVDHLEKLQELFLSHSPVLMRVGLEDAEARSWTFVAESCCPCCLRNRHI